MSHPGSTASYGPSSAKELLNEHDQQIRTMSLLPQYQQLPTDECATKASPAEDVEDVDYNPHSERSNYPPRYPANVSGTTTLIFVPKYPIKGSTESVLGVLGPNREETVSVAQRAFPTLAEYPSDRIEYLARLRDNASLERDTGWSRILPEAWERTCAHPPLRLKMMVVPTEEDLRARRKRDGCMCCFLMALIVSAILLGVYVATRKPRKR